MKTVSGFRSWLSHQRHRDDPIGDLARDLELDGCAADARTMGELEAHIREVHPSPDTETVIATQREAWLEYTRTVS